MAESDDDLTGLFEQVSKASGTSGSLADMAVENKRFADEVYTRVIAKTTPITDEEREGLAPFLDRFESVGEAVAQLVAQCGLVAQMMNGIDPSKPEHAGLLEAQADVLHSCEAVARASASFIRVYHEIERRMDSEPTDNEGGE